MKPLSIVATVAAAALIVAIGWMFGPGASWWLEHIDGVAGMQGEKLAAAVDAVRGRVLAVATGLAALLAVYYTARNADTGRRTFQLSERGHDTDRYSKAVEQLGSDQAPVRLGGLYALEQLAQNNPALRQRIVDVIAAYLRMPYTPPEHDGHEDARPAVPRAAIGGRAAQARGRDPHEERQVRLTAQLIITGHTRWPPSGERSWWSRPERPPEAFWPDIRLDLAGALLIDFDFRECRVSGALFSGVTFSGVAMFSRATFSRVAMFSGARFSNLALFDGATFSNVARFDNGAFSGSAMFSQATFSNVAMFSQATFSSIATFGGATFSGAALFDEAAFSRDASFSGATFSSRVSFAHASPGHVIDLDEAIVAAEAIEVDGHWPPGWVVEPGGKGSGLLRRDSAQGPGTARGRPGVSG